jgi:hypothetical protein
MEISLGHDFIHRTIGEPVLSNRFDKLGSEVAQVIDHKDTLFRRIGPGDQLPGFRLVDQFDSSTAGRDWFAVLVGFVDEASSSRYLI